jgi:hypothetical protein
MSWFTRCYRSGECGWFNYRTPDDAPITEQDAFFWLSLDAICRKFNEMIALERAKR